MPPDPPRRRACFLCMYPPVATPSYATALVTNSGPPIVFCFATPLIITRPGANTTKYIHQCDSPPVRLLGGEGTIPISSQYVTVVKDITQ